MHCIIINAYDIREWKSCEQYIFLLYRELVRKRYIQKSNWSEVRDVLSRTELPETFVGWKSDERQRAVYWSTENVGHHRAICANSQLYAADYANEVSGGSRFVAWIRRCQSDFRLSHETGKVAKQQHSSDSNTIWIEFYNRCCKMQNCSVMRIYGNIC